MTKNKIKVKNIKNDEILMITIMILITKIQEQFNKNSHEYINNNMDNNDNQMFHFGIPPLYANVQDFTSAPHSTTTTHQQYPPLTKTIAKSCFFIDS